MNLIDYLKKLYAAPSADAIALRELEDAKRKLLDAQPRGNRVSRA